jgi:hypothetical protein
MKAVITVGILGILCSACDHNSGGPLTAPLTITAAQELANANSLAQSYGKGLRLMTAPGSSCWQSMQTLPPSSPGTHNGHRESQTHCA